MGNEQEGSRCCALPRRTEQWVGTWPMTDANCGTANNARAGAAAGLMNHTESLKMHVWLSNYPCHCTHRTQEGERTPTEHDQQQKQKPYARPERKSPRTPLGRVANKYARHLGKSSIACYKARLQLTRNKYNPLKKHLPFTWVGRRPRRLPWAAGEYRAPSNKSMQCHQHVRSTKHTKLRKSSHT